MQDDKAETKYMTVFTVELFEVVFYVFKMCLFNLLLLLAPSVFFIYCSDEKTEAEIYLLSILKNQ